MFRPIASLAIVACACALVGPASALGAEAPGVTVSKAQPVTTGPALGIARAASGPKLWATVNVCDTAAAPDAMGVRAGVPTATSRRRVLLRFRAEYWDPSLQSWAPVADRGVSRWIYAGPARYERRQAGWTFQFAAPPAGQTFTMRAVVEFQWRERSRVVRSVSRVTQTGVRGVAGGDPAGTSKAMCLIY
jgi:hypothetical protein